MTTDARDTGIVGTIGTLGNLDEGGITSDRM